MSMHKTAIIKGRGRFPMDMLRYDRCWPRHSVDAQTIMDTTTDEYRNKVWSVEVVTNAKEFTKARWMSFGVGIEDSHC